MSFIETIRIAIRAILVNKTRALLTMLGVVIGVCAVILLVAIGSGIQRYIGQEFDKIGAGVLIVMPGDLFDENGGFSSDDRMAAAIAGSKLKYSDLSDLKRLRTVLEDVSVLFLNPAEARFSKQAQKTSTVGVNASYASIRNLTLSQGKFFSEEDERNRRKVVVLGKTIAEKLFGAIDPLAKNIQINGQTFTVIGVADKLGGGFGGPNFDAYLYIPAASSMALHDNERVTEFIVKAKNKDAVEGAIAEIKRTLGRRLKSDEYSVVETRQILDVINRILSVLTAGLGGIAAISLVVGGIGIMNIMLVSVTERTREIGLRKALGATPRLILLQFLVESSILSVIGGGIGVLLAALLSLLINNFFPAVVTLEAILLAFGVSVLIGVVFGVAPARRASMLAPIEALRYE